MASSADQKARKARTTNPGVRVQGGRIYDSETGTTCHQCRQKTVEVKAKCTACPLHLCPRCLLNRYGEDVSQVGEIQDWQCPRCRKLCNCSNCRKKGGFEATGILSHMCKAAGLASVSALLEQNPAAKRPVSASASADSAQPAVQAPKKRRKLATATSTASSAAAPAEWTAALPELQELSMPSTVSRGRREVTLGRDPLPDGCNAGDLLEILEFLKTFSGVLKLGAVSLDRLVQELLQPHGACRREHSGESSSCSAALHTCLLKHVRQAVGIELPLGFWQEGMRTYLADTLSAPPPLPCHAVDNPSGTAAAEADTEAVAAAVQAEEVMNSFDRQGYWGVPSHVRLAMLRSLCHQLLDAPLLRNHIDAEMEREEQAAKDSRAALAAARKASKEEAQKARDLEIAALLAGAGSRAMTLEEQQALMQQSSAKLSGADRKASGSAHTSMILQAAPLGVDREGRTHYHLACSPHFTGQESAVLICSYDTQLSRDSWVCCTTAQGLAEALQPHADPEAALRQALISRFSLQLPATGRGSGHGG